MDRDIRGECLSIEYAIKRNDRVWLWKKLIHLHIESWIRAIRRPFFVMRIQWNIFRVWLKTPPALRRRVKAEFDALHSALDGLDAEIEATDPSDTEKLIEIQRKIKKLRGDAKKRRHNES